ncbi:tubulin-like doman-containing protein [Cetobacterium sp.]|uniref:tubulin-like doman-containing protein n=1 Tax=Cetobacterium sp. TaxID=2071632 RepID=UPI003F30BDA8
MANKPALIIGLGGIGSRIVTDVYNEIPDNERKKVVVHVFDTDVNAAKKLGLKEKDITITSSDLTVRKCLAKDEIHKSNAEEWFPTDSPTILNTQFLTGAGQVRAISRLAYMDSIGSGRLNDLESKLADFSKLNGESHAEEIRIMIVSSLAGGTGSGIFLQTALYLRDYFQKEGKSVTIRGSFILPDILIKNNVLNGTHIRNIRANGYACLKELDAIIRSTMSSGNEHSVNIQLAYKPGMKDDEKVTKNPYDFIFLYDYENTDGKNLGSYQHYLDHVTKTVYLQLFSDIAGEASSDEINMLVNVIENNGRARYASAGVASLIYPYEDLVDYNAYRLANESLNQKWLKLDTLYENELDEYENYKKQGIHRELPKKHIRMNELFDNEVKNGDVFFKNINRTLHVVLKDNEIGAKKTSEFLTSIETRIEGDIESAKEYKESMNYKTPIQQNLVGKSDDLRNEVESFEAHLVRYKKSVMNSIDDKKNIIVTDMLPLVLIEENDISKFPHQLGYWLSGKSDGEALSPIASRYFFYDLKESLLNKVRGLEEEVATLYKGSEKYSNDFGEGKSAREALDEAVSKSSGIFGVFNRAQKTFSGEYADKATKQFRRIGNYCQKKIQLGVYTDLLKAVDEMIEHNEEGFFRALKEIMTDFSIKYHNLEKNHEEKNDVSKVYVLSKKEMKNKLYENLIKNIDTENIIKDSYNEIFKEKYSRFIARRKNENHKLARQMKDIFGDKIKSSYVSKIKLSEALDMDIIAAVRKECELKNIYGEEQNNVIESYITNIKNRAKPFSQKKGVNFLDLWGVNPIVLRNLSEQQAQNLFSNNGGNKNTVESSGFSKYEIIKYLSMHGLRAQDFEKFAPANAQKETEDGVYYSAYKEVIEKLNRNELTVTPHLDKRWHLINYMPDINDEQADIDKKAVTKGFVNGILYNIIQQRKDDGRSIWTFLEREGSSKPIEIGNTPVKVLYPNLLEGLGYTPYFVDDINLRIKEKKVEDFEFQRHALENHKFITIANTKDNKNIVDILIEYVNDAEPAKKKEAQVKIMEILNIFIEQAQEYIDEFYGDYRKTTSSEVAAFYISAALNESSKYSQSDKGVNFIEDLKNKISGKVESILKESGSSLGIETARKAKYEDLFKLIGERARG